MLLPVSIIYSFLLLSSSSCMNVSHCLSIQFLAVTNKAGMNIYGKSLYSHILSVFLGKYLGV